MATLREDRTHLSSSLQIGKSVTVTSARQEERRQQKQGGGSHPRDGKPFSSSNSSVRADKLARGSGRVPLSSSGLLLEVKPRAFSRMRKSPGDSCKSTGASRTQDTGRWPRKLQNWPRGRLRVPGQPELRRSAKPARTQDESLSVCLSVSPLFLSHTQSTTKPVFQTMLLIICSATTKI